MAPSGGILVFRRRQGVPEVFLVHPGGPFFAKKDLGAWTIPKGLCEPGEDEREAARRELVEETGFVAAGELIPLGEARQKSGKTVVAWACEMDCDPAELRSNSFTLEWPPRSGRRAEYPEVDRGAWYGLDEARAKIVSGQAVFLDRLLALLD